MEVIEDAAYAKAIAAEDEATYPADVAHAMMVGHHPVHAWRTHRELPLRALADLADVSNPYLDQIEDGKRASLVAKLAQALGVPLDILQP